MTDALADLLAGPVELAARGLLGVLLVHDGPAGAVVGRVVETEAYGGADDPASHAWRGRTPRNSVMFGRPGRLYVYRSHGLHWCANIVTGPAGQASAVLLRAAAVLDGTALAAARRRAAHHEPARREDVPVQRLARGPGNLCRAFGVDGVHDGLDLLAGGAVRLTPGVVAGAVRAGPRTGVSRGADTPWRFHLVGEPAVSAYRRSPRAPAPGG